MYKCKSTMCESDSLKNSAYCFEHYQKPEPSPASALVCREKLVKLKRRGDRVSSGTNSAWQGMASGMLASWAFGAGRKSGFESEAEVGKDAMLSSTFNAAAIAMVMSMMMTKEKWKKGDGDGTSI